ncbi:hypothetical protein DTL21_06330 [Bremerella cremea]|uniref:Uncharacterized protein n=1 Tax=Blastopirellula marina TaxID=124 RepID=A0A2S8FZE6_9BACT|nr:MULTISPECIES: MerC domain-containing protein [Pirellulaceae]PQO37558.1 hypothetical protein C5Y83_06330 [Blastopirellula marina]RCS49945.1 hypothetical protein DTL21_06330 [Bremerella cremea]
MDTAQPLADRDNPNLHVIGEGAYVTPRLLYLDVTPEKVVLMPREMSKMAMFGLTVLVTPLFAIFGVVAFMFGEHPWIDVGLVAAVWAVTCSIGVVVGWKTHRDSLQGPWLIIDRVKREFVFPRTGESFSFDEIDHLQDIGTYPFQASKWSEETCSSELHLVVNENGTQRRIPFLCGADDTTDEFHQLANALADLNLVPVKRIRGSTNSEVINQSWLTPELVNNA